MGVARFDTASSSPPDVTVNETGCRSSLVHGLTPHCMDSTPISPLETSASVSADKLKEAEATVVEAWAGRRAREEV